MCKHNLTRSCLHMFVFQIMDCVVPGTERAHGRDMLKNVYMQAYACICVGASMSVSKDNLQEQAYMHDQGPGSRIMNL